MSLTRLPTETIATMLEFADPPDIRRFRQVCRRFRNLVATNLYLQYVLELDMCGRVVPLVPRSDLSHAEKISALREHRRRWQNIGLVQPEFIKFRSKPDSVRLNCFVGGTFVCWEIDPDSHMHQTHESSHKVHFHQLPSFNKGTGYEYWHHDVASVRAVQLTIQPECDLLVLLEKTSVQAHTSVPVGGSRSRLRASTYHERYKLHLRTMGTNEPHPAVSLLAGTGLDFDITSIDFLPPRWKFELQVYESLVAVMLSRSLTAHIVIWNWLSGSQVARIHLSETRVYDSFRFVSEDYLIIPCVGGSESLERLLLYRLPTYSDEAKPSAHCVAEFILPPHCSGMPGLSMSARAAPAMATTALYRKTQLKTWPKIFDVAPSVHLIHVPISIGNTRSLDYFSPYHSRARSETLVVPTQALFDTLAEAGGTEPAQPGHVISIPWGTWGHSAARVNTGEGRTCSFWYGHRLAAFEHVSTPDSPHTADSMAGCDIALEYTPMRSPDQIIHIWDFNQLRLRTGGANRLSSSPGLEQISLGAAQEYTETGMRLERGLAGRLVDVMLSDEHVVLELDDDWQPGDSLAELGRGLLVYIL